MSSAIQQSDALGSEAPEFYSFSSSVSFITHDAVGSEAPLAPRIYSGLSAERIPHQMRLGPRRHQPYPHGSEAPPAISFQLLLVSVSFHGPARAVRRGWVRAVSTSSGHAPAAARPAPKQRLFVRPGRRQRPPVRLQRLTSKTGALCGLSRGPSEIDPCPLLRPQVYGSGQNIT